jgi:asparagine synthase (glutamine-hydrolysing)
MTDTAAGAWLAAFDEHGPSTRRRHLHLVEGTGYTQPGRADDGAGSAFFDGTLYNGVEVMRALGVGPSPSPSDADLVLRAYRKWGTDAIARFKGVFALAISDWDAERLLLARDPCGVRPLFVAEAGGSLLISPSIETLLRHPGLPGDVSRLRLVENLSHRVSRLDETYFVGVSRVLPGHVLRIDRSGRHSEPYWQILPRDKPVEWVPDAEADGAVRSLLEATVGRYINDRPGILLSGGIDSSAIGVVAADVCQAAGTSPPHAFSLEYPAPYDDAQSVGRGVATRLGMAETVLPFDTVGAPGGYLTAGMRLSASMPAPLFDVWAPAYQRLSGLAADQGCGVLLTGHGGDEWFGVSHRVAMDWMRCGNLVGIQRLWRSQRRFIVSPHVGGLSDILWGHGIRPNLLEFSEASALGRGMRARLESVRERPTTAGPMPWIAPDPDLRALAIATHDDARHGANRLGRSRHRGYVNDVLSRFESGRLVTRLEEAALLAQRTGVHTHDPFWDPDLMSLTARIHPRVRLRGGLTKALTREPLARRFPDLGFGDQKKFALGSFIEWVMANEALRAFDSLGGEFHALGDLGIVDRVHAKTYLTDQVPGREWQTWDLLNLEAWARAHT